MVSLYQRVIGLATGGMGGVNGGWFEITNPPALPRPKQNSLLTWLASRERA